MKKILSLTLTALALFLTSAYAKTQTADWIRTADETGEFSIDFPAKYDFLADKDGFFVSDYPNIYELKQVRMLNSFSGNSLLTVECYEAKKGALDIIFDDDRKNGKVSEIQSDGNKIRQITYITKEFYAVRQYFNSERRIYVLTAVSKTGETETIKRFLGSVYFKPGNTNTDTAGTIPFSRLKVSAIVIEKGELNDSKKADSNLKTKQNDDEEPLTVVFKPRASYTESARMKGIQGLLDIKNTFTENGFVSKIQIIKELPEGLLRQAVFAAFRIKFLPAEKNGIPQTVAKRVQYKFTLY